MSLNRIMCYSRSIATFFLLFLSGEAESGLERLHQCAEKELQVYLDAESPSKDFNDFRTKLAGLTRYSKQCLLAIIIFK